MSNGGQRRPPSEAGLCATCTHVQVVTSSKGRTFYKCQLSETDPRFPRYPALPVIVCAGYRPIIGSDE